MLNKLHLQVFISTLTMKQNNDFGKMKKICVLRCVPKLWMDMSLLLLPLPYIQKRLNKIQ